MKRIILRAGEEKRMLAGHPWVYDNEVAHVLNGSVAAELEAGESADVESIDKVYVGRAIVNPRSKIIARIYSPSKEGMDTGFFKRRMREAFARRECYDFSRESARLVFAEADMLPGLIIDRYVGWPLDAVESAALEPPLDFLALQEALGPPRSWFSLQFLCFGMDARREMIVNALHEAFFPLGPPDGIIERSAKVRELEGLPSSEGIIRGSVPGAGIVIFEHGFPLIVNLEKGQKTGCFLDQKENRSRMAALVKSGERVLDVFAYTGGFSIGAARAGADSVMSVDCSKEALEPLRWNARLNGVEHIITPVQADAFETLRSLERSRKRFDCVVLDPPAFAKTHSALDNALRGYKEINLRALKLLNAGGILVTCSCCHALDEQRFKQLIAEAALDAERRIYQIDFRYQSPDHPVLVGYDESLYLKAGFYRVAGK
jgi:23S rRNA (cytosine1962-C5)-methyltransferase